MCVALTTRVLLRTVLPWAWQYDGLGVAVAWLQALKIIWVPLVS